MRYRVLASTGALAVTVAVLTLAAGSVSGQTPGPGAKAYNPPRTADGHPDISGVWSHNAATPFERPKELEGRATLTDAELAALKRNAAKLFNGDTDAAFGDSVFLAALKESKDFKSTDTQTGNYNHFWLVDREFDNRTSLIVDPPDGRLPPLTPEAQKRQADAAEYNKAHYADGPENVPHNCYGGSLPILGAGYNNYYQIAQSAGSVGILMEMMHDVRVVPTDGRPALDPTIQMRLGSSRGRWDGDTLVVDTTNFKDNVRGGGAGGRGTTATTRLTEKFTRISATTLKYEVTVNDPSRFSKPWTAVLYWKAEPKNQIYEFACHEGNEAMAGTLSGYRAQEREAAESAKKGSR
jgi:hypothetical protein